MHCAITFDSYCDKSNHRAYTAYTFHRINDQWQLNGRVLKTGLSDSPHTARNICDEFNKVVDEYELNNKKIVCVTDSASTMIAACRLIGNNRQPCLAHKANTLIQKDMLKNDAVKQIPALLSKIRAGQKKLLYRFEMLQQIRDQDNQNQLAFLLNELSQLDDVVNAENQFVSGEDDTILNTIRNLENGNDAFNGLKAISNIRFGCLYKLSKFYKDNSSIIKKSLENIEQYDLIMNRNELALLDGLVELLDIFNVFTTFVQGNEYPTMNTFALFYSEIVDRLQKIVEYDDDDVITEAAQILLANINRRLPLTDECIGAAIIDPNMQRLPIIEERLTSKSMQMIIYYPFSETLSTIFPNSINAISFFRALFYLFVYNMNMHFLPMEN